MFDIHSHVLPGFDDGARDWQTAVNMCRRAAQDGIHGIVASPHFHRSLFDTPKLADVHARVAELQNYCQKGLIDDFKVYMGSDCHVHDGILKNVLSGTIPTVNGSRYLLLELEDDTLPRGLRELVFEMSVAGVTPIITHPERNRVLARHPSGLYDLVRSGAFAQVTAGSLTGQFGTEVKEAAEQLLRLYLVQIIASDAHDTERRPPILSAGRNAAARVVGEELAQVMVNDAPRAVLENKLIQFPEPRKPDKRKPGLWRRLVGG